MVRRRKKSARPPASNPASEKTNERVRAWLGHYGAPLLVTAHLGPKDVPPLEQALVRGVGLAHWDATVASVLPLVLWHQRQQLDLTKLAHLAKEQGEAQSLGLFLDLTRELTGDRTFGRAARTLRDRRYRRMKYFFIADGRTELSRGITRLHTPKVAKRWHFFMNAGFDSFESLFRKFIRVADRIGRDASPSVGE